MPRSPRDCICCQPASRLTIQHSNPLTCSTPQPAGTPLKCSHGVAYTKSSYFAESSPESRRRRPLRIVSMNQQLQSIAEQIGNCYLLLPDRVPSELFNIGLLSATHHEWELIISTDKDRRNGQIGGLAMAPNHDNEWRAIRFLAIEGGM